MVFNTESYEWLRDVLIRLPMHPINRIKELLPHNWKTRQTTLFTIDPKNFHPLNYDGRNLCFLYRRDDRRMQLFLLLVSLDIDRGGGKLDAALKQAASWHASGLNAEDEKKYGKRSTMNLLSDYNALTSGMKVIELPAVKKYILCDPNGVTSFDSPEAMDQFMSDTLGYNELQVESGNHNVYDPQH